MTYEDAVQRQAMREFAQSPEGQRFLMDITAAKTSVTISWSESNNGNFDINGQEATIRLPKDMVAFRVASGEVRATLTVVLAHEAGHYYTRAKFGPAVVVDGDELVMKMDVRDRSEIGASRFENGYRTWSGIPTRTTYGELPVPQSACTLCLP